MEHNRLDQPQQILLADGISAFVRSRRVKGLSPRTISYYTDELGQMRLFCASISVYAITDLTADVLRKYIEHMQEKRNRNGVHANYRAVRSFLHWVDIEYEPQWTNPLRCVQIPSPSKDVLPPVKFDTIKAMLDACDTKTFIGVRDYALILCLLDTGARANEFLSVNLADLETATGTIQLHKEKTKSGKARTTYLGQKARIALKRYIKTRKDNCPAMWITEHGTRLRYQGLRAIFDRVAETAGIEKPKIHSFRRTFAITLLRKHVDIYRIMKLGGWQSMEVLRRYLAVNDDDAREAHEEGGPVDLGLFGE